MPEIICGVKQKHYNKIMYNLRHVDMKGLKEMGAVLAGRV